MEGQGGQGLAAPPGSWISVPSALTGQLLEYFVPDPLTHLVHRLPQSAAQRHPWDDAPIASVFPLVGYLVRAASDRHRSGDLAELHRRVLFGELSLKTQSDLLALGAQVSSRASRFREQMAFAGGTTPSSASTIFAPPSAIPELFSALAKAFANLPKDRDPVDLSALTGYYLIQMHPFEDGNGRFARMLAFHVGARSGSPWSGAASAVFIAACRQGLAETWMRARREGMIEYLSQVRMFRSELFDLLEKVGVVDALMSLLDRLSLSNNKGPGNRCIYELLTRGGLSSSHVRGIYNCSQKKAGGLIFDMANEMKECVELTSDGLRADKLMRRFDDAVHMIADAGRRETSS